MLTVQPVYIPTAVSSAATGKALLHFYWATFGFKCKADQVE